MAKEQTIETILYQNNELLKLGQYYNKNIEQETLVSKAEENINKLGKKCQQSKKEIIGVVESTAKETKSKNAEQINQNNSKNNLEINPQKMKNTKKVFIVGDSIIKNITSTGITRVNTVKMRPPLGATTVDICET